MSTLANQIPAIAWPLISALLGFALGAMLSLFLILFSWLKEWGKEGTYGRRIFSNALSWILVCFFIAAISFIGGLVLGSSSESRSLLGGTLMLLTTIGTLLAFYKCPLEYFKVAQNTIYERR